MKRRNAIALMATIVGGAIVAGSGLTAWANWAVSATPARGTVRAEQMPAVTNLAVAHAGGKLTFSWSGAKFASGAAVGGYRVESTGGAVVAEICKTTALSCEYTPKGKPSGTFVVRALAGSTWVGPASAPVTVVPGTKTGTGEQAAAAQPPVTGDVPGGSAPQATKEPAPATPTVTPAGNDSEKDSGTVVEKTPDSPAATPEKTSPAPAQPSGTAEPASPAE